MLSVLTNLTGHHFPPSQLAEVDVWLHNSFTLKKFCIQIPITVLILFLQFNWICFKIETFLPIPSECTVWCIMPITVFVALKWSWKDLNGSIKLYLVLITHSLIFFAPVSGTWGYNLAPLCDENSTWIEPDAEVQCMGHALRYIVGGI